MTLEIIITLMSILAPIQGGVHSNYVLPEQISISKVSENSTVGSVYWTRKRGFWVSEGHCQTRNCVGEAIYKNEVNKTGWAILQLETFDTFSDFIQASGAGYLEGWMTRDILYMQYLNTIVGRCDGKQELCEKINDWVKSNHKWVIKQIEKSRGSISPDPFWHHVGLFYDQMVGLYQGYRASVKDTAMDVITLEDIVTMNIFGDLEDLEQVFDTNDHEAPKVQGIGHCSALIRLIPNNTDLYVSHDTWNSYQSMLRILKRYKMPLRSVPKGEKVPGDDMSFSSYPGVIYSGDDFTLTSSGLTILETTIGNNNKDNWRFVTAENSVLEGIRATVANRLAKDGQSWTEIFSKHNSGTYNNQWMVINNNLFTPGEKDLQPGLLWVLEQIPGFIRKEDVTNVLKSQNFWPSYNTPYFPDVFEKSGNPELVKEHGDWFSYDKTPRALIFARDAPQVYDIDSMIKLMRYNNYTMDPLSKCDCNPPYSGENAISARNDLNPRNGTYPFHALSHRSHGGTDMKMTSFSLAQNLQFIAQSGPTWDPLPPFQWSLQDFMDTPHVGHPDLWQFEPIIPKWITNDEQF